MKRSILVIVGVLLISFKLSANYFSYLPYTISQPNGDTIVCFVSGDEYFNWIHDQEGYTIIQAPDGYFYYGEASGNDVVPTKYKVNSANPADLGLKKWAKISVSEYQKAKATFDKPDTEIKKAPHSGTLNNLVVYIRFSDDTEFTDTRQTFDNKFNPSTGISLKSYFNDVSYNQFTVSSSHYPDCALTTNLSYQDTHPRSYFQPYNATTNPGGYQGGDNGSERTSREHTLLSDAINWINANSPVSGSLNIDGDNDNYVDNVCFNIRGGNGGWACLLWAHSWSLYSFNVNINGKRVYKYTFQPETQVSVQTLCHEMFHAVGAPDLYHYTGNGIAPVSSWDLMESGFGHMGAYMKWKYSNHTWISSIPEITASGTYTLNPLASSTNNCYKIASANSTSQFYIVEYRRATGTFESYLPGSGLLVYRINTYAYGNSSGPPDEVYIYRPEGTTIANGNPSTAHFSSETGRTAINDATNPSGFLQDGSLGGLDISNVTSAGNTISFTVGYTIVLNPTDFTATPSSQSQINLEWKKNANNDSILLLYSTTPTFGTPVNGTAYSIGNTISGGGTVISSGSDTLCNHTGLQAETYYYYKLFSYNSDTTYSSGITQYATTPCGTIASFPWSEDFEYNETTPDCWSQVLGGVQGNGWMYFSGNGENNPQNAHSGYMNACLRDYSTADNISQLITPIFDLTAIEHPTLTFWHTQAASASNQDILTVYYKTTEKGSWTQLATYTSSITSWTEEKIDLPDATSTYTISFEGNAKSGYGVCLDDVSIMDSSLIPPTLEITTVVIGDNESECYNATDTITVAGGRNTVEFMSGSTVNLIAGQSISFLPGFHAHEGSYMYAYITENSEFCNSLVSAGSVAEIPAMQKSTILFAEENISKSDKIKEKQLKIFPNPTTGKFTLELINFEGISLITVSNMLGTTIYHSKIHNNQSSVIDLSSLSKGIYIVNVKNANNSTIAKVIIH